MEHIEGPTLLELLHQQPENNISEERTKKYIKQILTALKYLHGLGIKHGDITPENIILNT
jgi:serine/threonine protein kinase